MSKKKNLTELDKALAAADKLRIANENKDKERRRLVRESAAKEREIAELNKRLGEITQLAPEDVRVPKWVSKSASRKGKHNGTPVLMLSDLHLDEVVDPVEMDGLNAFNRKIAELRWERTINSTVELMESYVAGLDFDGIVVCLGGDIITGDIHDELVATNEHPVPETIKHWVPLIASGLVELADHFGKVFVPCVDGNHDRLTDKTRYKKRAENSFAWIIYHWLADHLRDDDRITFSISHSPDLYFPVYNTNFLLSHGDAFRGGGGVGGIYPPMLKWLNKKMNVRQFDIALIGHWHQLLYGQGIYVNGSLKGYDEYARGHALGMERPQQMLFVVTPENGVTIRTQVYSDSKSERKLWT